MAESRDRLRRYLADEWGECRDGELERRLAELEALEEDVEPTLEEDVEVLSALADDTRYRIVRLLAAADGELSVCELTPLLDVSDSAVSHALTQLTDAGLVVRRKDGRWRKYRTTNRADALFVALDGTRYSGR